jgi:hypothetical protein
MKTFKSFIFEESGYTNIQNISPYQEKIKWLQENTSPIYRGMRHHTGKYVLFNGNENYKRVSANTHNLYTILMSEYFPKWKDYPKRNKSLICSLSFDTATSYGSDVYRVFPLENQVIGICPANDWWTSFEKTKWKYHTSSMMLFMDNILNIFYELIDDVFIKRNDIENIFTNIRDTIDYLEKMTMKLRSADEKLINALKETVSFRDPFFDEIISGKESFYSILEKIFDPDKNKFSKMRTITNESTSSFNSLNREVWVSGKCLLILENEHDF